MNFARPLTALFSILLASTTLAQQIDVTADHPTGIYNTGEQVTWHVTLKNAPTVKQLKYTLKRDGLTVVKEATLDLTDNAATLTATLDQPGMLLADVRAKVNDKDLRGLGGAAFDPQKLQPTAPCPDDFDAFWKSKLDELAAVPVNAQVDPADSDKPTVDYFKIRLDNIRNTHVYGQLAKPKKPGKFPALLVVQYAGVYGLPPKNVVPRAEAGWLALNIMAHDLPFDRDDAFYKQQSAGPLKDYLGRGVEDREKSYFLRMYLGCYRACEYLTGRDDWDGKTLVVIGTSQGGQQSLVTAGLFPKVTTMIANVPAGCDVTGPLAGRAAGYPYWINNGRAQKVESQAITTAKYYDTVNFAARMKCPSLVALGLIDETCPPAGVYTAANQIQGPVTVLVMPKSNHHGDGNAQAAFWSTSEKWLSSIVQGKGVPASPK